MNYEFLAGPDLEFENPPITTTRMPFHFKLPDLFEMKWFNLFGRNLVCRKIIPWNLPINGKSENTMSEKVVAQTPWEIGQILGGN